MNDVVISPLASTGLSRKGSDQPDQGANGLERKNFTVNTCASRRRICRSIVSGSSGNGSRSSDPNGASSRGKISGRGSSSSDSRGSSSGGSCCVTS